MTYINNIGSDMQISYQSGEQTQEHVVPAGARFTFDETQDNAAEIEQALINAGATKE